MAFNLTKVEKDSASLSFLYETKVGRILLKPLVSRGLSNLAGKYLDSSKSKWLIKKFVKNNNINLDDYIKEDYPNFNACFSRHIKPELRPVDTNPNHLVSPCDGLLSVYPIKEGLVMPIKQSKYTVEDLILDKELAKEYDEGLCLVFRLCVHHYHRYAYLDNGTKGKNIFIPGILHTVRPIALKDDPIFVENCREYTVLDTENLGKVVQVEVGAMLVGKIANNHEEYTYTRGEEKGCFLYGGSTIIILLKKDTVALDPTLLKTNTHEYEVEVKMGEKLGDIIKNKD